MGKAQHLREENFAKKDYLGQKPLNIEDSSANLSGVSGNEYILIRGSPFRGADFDMSNAGLTLENDGIFVSVRDAVRGKPKESYESCTIPIPFASHHIRSTSSECIVSGMVSYVPEDVAIVTGSPNSYRVLMEISSS